MSQEVQLSNDNLAQERFVDYFVICGLDEVNGLERHQTSKDGNASLSPLQTSYKCSILWHFPECDSSNIFEGDAIKLLCMPRGVYFQRHIQDNHGKFHSFMQTKEDGTKIYGFVLTFYERVINEKILTAMETLYKMYNTESLLNGSYTSLNKNCSKTKCIQGKVTNTLHTFTSCTDKLYVSKCICIIMKKPFVTLVQQCLEDILTVGLNEVNHDLRVESLIYHTLFEIPNPPYGSTLKHTSVNGSPIILHNPNLNEVPYFDYSMKEVLMTLGFDNLVDLFTCMLLEHQILFLSSNLNKLMLVAESLTTLFFPLLWQHVYVPVLPPSLLHFLDAPVPFIMGLYYETEEEKDRFEIPCEASLCLLDIDENDLLLPQEIPELPGREELIKELKYYADMYGIVPPEGSIRLRNDLDGSEEDLTSDWNCECPRSNKYGSCSNLASAATGTWPRKKKSMTPSMGRKTYKTSPPVTKKKMSLSSASPVMGRRLSVSSNWAGETTPQVHRETDRSSRKPTGKKMSATSISNPRLAKMILLAEKKGMNTADLLKGMKEEKTDNVLGNSNILTQKDDLFVMSSRAATVMRKQQHENEFNIVVQELFVNIFTQMLVDYEHFVILPQQTKDDWLHNREHMQNFDKASFLSDQSQLNLSFMTLFVETQGFASLIDMKIMALWENCDPKLAYFDKRIDKLKVKLGVIRNPVYEKCTSITHAIQQYILRCSSVDCVAIQPHALKVPVKREMSCNYFPSPETNVLLETRKKKSGKSSWKRKEKIQQQQQQEINNMNESVKNNDGQKIKDLLAEKVKKYMQDSKTVPKDNANASVSSQKTLHVFGEKLLEECMKKTKKLVILKLGQEAVELGHTDPSTGAIEENTIIASICDLLERVWCHGVQLRQLEFGKESAKSKFVQRMRQSKSALWSHLLAFYHKETARLAAVYGLPNTENITDDVQKLIVEMSSRSPNPRTKRKGSTVDILSGNITRIMKNISPDTENAPGIGFGEPGEAGTPNSPATENRKKKELFERMAFIDNLQTVLNMTEIKTDTGYARAWTRLALEKKVLAKDLRILLSHKKLLTTRYKEYAFIRTEDEIEQFLYHLLSLNAVDFFCFTNGFSNTMVIYKVQITIGKQIGSFTTANCWINLTGSFGHTGTVNIPKGDLEFLFKHKNLGILNALRIGHDSSGMSPAWFIECVNVTNEITGRLYRFQCQRWLAKGHDDGSTERLLIAEVIDDKRYNEHRPSTLCLGISDKPVERNVPSSKPKVSSIFSKKLLSTDIQEKVADAVNNIVKYFFKDSEENMTVLLCGENGFCDSLELVFRYGFKSNRLFGKKLFIWDYLERICESVIDLKFQVEGGEYIKRGYLSTIQHINAASLSIGKDQKFQLFICLGLREHQLQQWFELLHTSPVTQQMYESSSFFRDRSLLNFLIEVLEALTEFDVVLDKSITRGI